jgi:hypothetical protein
MHGREHALGGHADEELRRECGGPNVISPHEEAALRHARFDDECAKLDPAGERALAEEGLAADLAHWPEY